MIGVEKIEIKRFRECDLEAVWAIQRAAFRPLYERYRDEDISPFLEDRETLLRKYTRENTCGYVFWLDGAPAGAVRVTLCPAEKSARLSGLCVLPALQGRGIAQQALGEIERRHGDVKRWSLDTIREEAGNCHLYEKLGYRRTGESEPVNDRMTLVAYEKRRPGRDRT